MPGRYKKFVIQPAKEIYLRSKLIQKLRSFQGRRPWRVRPAVNLLLLLKESPELMAGPARKNHDRMVQLMARYPLFTAAALNLLHSKSPARVFKREKIRDFLFTHPEITNSYGQPQCQVGLEDKELKDAFTEATGLSCSVGEMKRERRILEKRYGVSVDEIARGEAGRLFSRLPLREQTIQRADELLAASKAQLYGPKRNKSR